MKDKPIGSCPGCNQAFDVILGDYEPKPNDISICINCGQLNVFTSDFNQRLATTRDLALLKFQDPENYSKIIRASIFIKGKKQEQSNKVRNNN